MTNFKLICVSSPDFNFQVNKEYEVSEGFLYTENDISINTRAYISETDAIQDLKTKGYIFKPQTATFAFGGNFNTDNIFGEFNESGKSMNQKRTEAENMKNDILNSILKNMV